MVKPPNHIHEKDDKMGQADRDLLLTALLVIFSLFLAPNYSGMVGLFYTGMALAYGWAYTEKRLPQITVERTNGKKALSLYLIGSFAAVTAWFVGSSFIIANQNIFAISDTLKLFATQTTPILASTSSAFLDILIYGIHVPFVETLGILGFMLALIAIKIFKIPIMWQPSNLKMWWVIGLIGMSAALFHLTAHQPTDINLSLEQRIAQFDQAMIVDALFFSASAALVFYYGHLLPALLIHVGVNSLILAIRYGLIKL